MSLRTLFVALVLAAPAVAAPLNLSQEPGYVAPAYWSRFPATKGRWDKPDFYPIGVWLQNVTTPAEAALDKAAGINTYVGITAPSDPAVVRAAGMYIIQQWEVTQPSTPSGIHANYGAETVGWLVGDEYDMRHGPGWGGWDGIDAWQHCTTPSKQGCGFTVAHTIKKKFPGGGRFYMQNFAKGVLFGDTDGDAAQWTNGSVNNGTLIRFHDTFGTDVYWSFDRDVCTSNQGGKFVAAGLLVGTGPPDWAGANPTLKPGECQRMSNVAAVTARMRALDGKDGAYQPLWCALDVGRGTPGQLQGQVAACLISGAYPLYFNHVFEVGPVGDGKGPCVTQQALRDGCYAGHRAAAMAIGAFIQANAPMLNSPRLVWDFAAPKLLTRLSQAPNGDVWVFAMQKIGQSGSHTLALPAGAWTGAMATCSDATGAVPVVDGKLQVTFAHEWDWCAWRLSEAAVPPSPIPVPPPQNDPSIMVNAADLAAAKAAAKAALDAVNKLGAP